MTLKTPYWGCWRVLILLTETNRSKLVDPSIRPLVSLKDLSLYQLSTLVDNGLVWGHEEIKYTFWFDSRPTVCRVLTLSPDEKTLLSGKKGTSLSEKTTKDLSRWSISFRLQTQVVLFYILSQNLLSGQWKNMLQYPNKSFFKGSLVPSSVLTQSFYKVEFK